MTKKNRITLTVIILLGFVALITGIFFAQHLTPRKNLNVKAFQGTLLQNPREISDFNLLGTNEAPFTKNSMKNHWTMVFLGFTNCGSICPTTMAELGKMYIILEEKKVSPLPQVVFISVDSERDDLKKIKQYTTAFNPHFIGARGEPEAIKTLANELGVAFEKSQINPENADQYDIQHNGAIMLFNPEGKLTAFFTMPHNAASLTADYQLLIQ